MKLVVVSMFVLTALNCNSQIITIAYSPTDLIGVWEYQIPGSNEYIGFQFTSQFGIVNGEFFKYFKDVNGQMTVITFDSRADTIPGAMSNEAMGAIKPLSRDCRNKYLWNNV